MPRRAEVPELENRMKYGGKKFVRYEEAPGNIQQKVIDEAKALAEAEG